MTQEHWEAMAALVKPKSEIGEFLSSLKNEEGEFRSFEEGFPTFQEAFKARSDGRYGHGKAERSQDLNRFLKDKYGLDIDVKKANTEEAFESYITKLKESFETPVLTRESLAENEIVKQLLNEASKGKELTEESAKANPLVQRLMQDSFKAAESKANSVIEELRTDLKGRMEKEVDSNLTNTLLEWAGRNKIDFNIDDSDPNAEQLKKNAINLLKVAARQQAAGWKHNENGEFLPLDDKGNYITNPTTGFPIPFDEFMGGISPYRPHLHDPSKKSPQPKGTPKQPAKGTHDFANMDGEQVYETYTKMLSENKAEEANALMDAYDEYESSQG